MLLIIHAGLHKAASTYFQHLLLLNLDALVRNGVYAYPDPKLMGHHRSAWNALRGDYRLVQAHVAQAKRLGLATVVLTSEDFEGLIFSPAHAAALEVAARQAGARQVKWHFCLRDPGQYLLSIADEIAKHAVVDFVAMSLGALRDGRYRVARPAGSLPDAWEFCFDPGSFLPAFAARVTGRVDLHDFRDDSPFPLHALYERLAGDAPPALPGDAARNARAPGARVEEDLSRRVREVVAGTGLDDQVGLFVDRLTAPPALREACAAALSRKFAPGMERILADGVGKG